MGSSMKMTQSLWFGIFAVCLKYTTVLLPLLGKDVRNVQRREVRKFLVWSCVRAQIVESGENLNLNSLDTRRKHWHISKKKTSLAQKKIKKQQKEGKANFSLILISRPHRYLS